MNLKHHFATLSVLSLFYVSSASASLVNTSFTGEVLGFNGAVGSVSVTFTYDTSAPSAFSATAAIGSFGDYHANNFILASHTDSYMSFTAPTETGTTTNALHLLGNFTGLSPDNFAFDNRSYATGNTYGMPHFGVDMVNSSVVTSAVNPVPVPAAVWLFGSGLIGLAGISRRNKA